jgi:hypothetical protein
MQSPRSTDYFRNTLNAALNYFGRKQKQIKKSISNKCTIESTDDDLIEIVAEDELPIIEPSKSLHNSYKLFYKRLPATVARDSNIRQGRVREYYKQSFNNKQNLIPKAMIQLNSSEDIFDDLDVNDIEEAFEHDLENNFETIDDNDDEQNENQFLLLETLPSNDEDEDQSLNDNCQQIDIEQKDTTTLV